MLALAMMLLNVNTLTEHLQWLLLLVHFANPTQWVQISFQGAFLLWYIQGSFQEKGRVNTVSSVFMRLTHFLNFRCFIQIMYRWSPTYRKITNAVPHLCGFSLCTRKWRNLALVESLEQSHLREFRKIRVRRGPSVSGQPRQEKYVYIF